MHNWVDDPIFIYFFLIIMNKIIPYIPCGIWPFHHHSMESTWNSIHMDIPSIHVEFGHSITIPYGIQVEWRSQNEWDLSQNIFHMKWWIPHGFHVE